MMNKIIMLILAFVIFLPIILIAGLIALLGIGIAGLIIGWWTVLGIILVCLSIFIAIIPPHIKIWIPLLIGGFILIFVDLLNII